MHREMKMNNGDGGFNEDCESDKKLMNNTNKVYAVILYTLSRLSNSCVPSTHPPIINIFICVRVY